MNEHDPLATYVELLQRGVAISQRLDDATGDASRTSILRDGLNIVNDQLDTIAKDTEFVDSLEKARASAQAAIEDTELLVGILPDEELEAIRSERAEIVTFVSAFMVRHSVGKPEQIVDTAVVQVPAVQTAAVETPVRVGSASESAVQSPAPKAPVQEPIETQPEAFYSKTLQIYPRDVYVFTMLMDRNRIELARAGIPSPSDELLVYAESLVADIDSTVEKSPEEIIKERTETLDRVVSLFEDQEKLLAFIDKLGTDQNRQLLAEYLTSLAHDDERAVAIELINGERFNVVSCYSGGFTKGQQYEVKGSGIALPDGEVVGLNSDVKSDEFVHDDKLPITQPTEVVVAPDKATEVQDEEVKPVEQDTPEARAAHAERVAYDKELALRHLFDGVLEPVIERIVQHGITGTLKQRQAFAQFSFVTRNAVRQTKKDQSKLSAEDILHLALRHSLPEQYGTKHYYKTVKESIASALARIEEGLAAR